MTQIEFDKIMAEAVKTTVIDATAAKAFVESLNGLVTRNELTEVMELQEAAAGTRRMKIRLIAPGKGSMGYYSESALKKAVKDGIFSKGHHMYLNHPTQEERAVRPEGDVTKLAAVLAGNAYYVEGSKAGVYADVDAFPDYAPFLAARKDHIGVSVRIAAEPSGKLKDGVPLVENILFSPAVDFVTKAGAGGKIEELYESYRGQHPGQHSGNPPQENEVTNEELQAILQEALKPLQTQITGLQGELAKRDAAIDRLQEANTNNNADRIVQEALVNSGLSARGQQRVKSVALANVPMTATGTIDVVKLQEAVKAAVTEEKAYLQESGVRTTPVVMFNGGSGISMLDEAGKPRTDDAILQEADKTLGDVVGSFLGKEKKAS